jgi:hypothetical protein
VAEGNGLLNRHTVKSGIGGSNPPLSDLFLFKLCGSKDLNDDQGGLDPVIFQPASNSFYFASIQTVRWQRFE